MNLNDFVTSNIDQLVNEMVIKKFDKKQIDNIRLMLKSWFQFKPKLLYQDNIINIKGTELQIIQCDKRSRVKFGIKGTDDTFTCSKNYLLGIELEIPFEIGDSVLYKNEVCKVKQIMVNQHIVVIDTEVYTKRVDVRQLKKFYAD